MLVDGAKGGADCSGNLGKVSAILAIYKLYCVLKDLDYSKRTAKEKKKLGFVQDVRPEYGGKGGAHPKEKTSSSHRVN